MPSTLRIMNSGLEWQKRYESQDTPWDKGSAAPPLVSFLRKRPITGNILVPGCGRGHDVRELARQPQTQVVGLDLSSTAIVQARDLVEPADARQEILFLEGDFFNLAPSLQGSFDWLVEHACFCAIDPSQRPDYVRSAAAALRPGGRIFAIFYLNPDVDEGPPFAVSKAELSELFAPLFDLLEEWVPDESYPGRENRELVRLLKKR